MVLCALMKLDLYRETYCRTPFSFEGIGVITPSLGSDSSAECQTAERAQIALSEIIPPLGVTK